MPYGHSVLYGFARLLLPNGDDVIIASGKGLTHLRRPKVVRIQDINRQFLPVRCLKRNLLRAHINVNNLALKSDHGRRANTSAQPLRRL
jgi:hypothetical protein